MGTNQTINPTTPGSFNFVYADNRILTKSAGSTSDIERLYFNGFNQTFNWTDLNTCKQYIGISDIFNYSGINANGRTTSYLGANTVNMTCPASSSQTISNIVCNRLSIRLNNNNTITNITSINSVGPSLGITGAGTNSVVNINEYSSFSTSSTLNPTGTGTTVTITNLYGLFLRSPSINTATTNITNNYGIYQQSSSSKNWFAASSNQFPNIGTTASASNVFLDSSNSNILLRSTSSLKYKQNILPTEADKILDLRPIKYRSNSEYDDQTLYHYGLIAEEVEVIDPRLVHYGYQEDAYELVNIITEEIIPQDDPRRAEGIVTETVTKKEKKLKSNAQKVADGVAYDRLTVLLLDIVKRQQKTINSLSGEINNIKQHLSL